jgi:hypothetical protein
VRIRVVAQAAESSVSERYVPVFLIGLVLPELGGDFIQLPTLFLVLLLLGLFLPYRKFFPRK